MERGLSVVRSQYPRPKGRGLIEGGATGAAPRRWATRIHGQKVVASLKGAHDRRHHPPHYRYPRPKGRGLIEGSLRRLLPIDAPGIHGQKVVASLKGDRSHPRRNKGTGIHGRKVVASLKGFVLSRYHILSSGIHGRKVVASFPPGGTGRWA